MEAWKRKTEYLVGQEACRRLADAHVAVVGIGGVGAFAAEFLGRAGIGHLTLVDGDSVSESNRNRQLPALCSTTGQSKTEVMAGRLRDINPSIDVRSLTLFLKPDDAPAFIGQADQFRQEPFLPFDTVVDAIDTVPSKVALIAACLQARVPVVSAMGAAGKLDPAQVRCTDISKTFQCPLAKAVRNGLKKAGITSGVPVVFSTEVSDLTHAAFEEGERPVPGSVSYMPALFGGWLSSYVIRKLINDQA